MLFDRLLVTGIYGPQVFIEKNKNLWTGIYHEINTCMKRMRSNCSFKIKPP